MNILQQHTKIVPDQYISGRPAHQKARISPGLLAIANLQGMILKDIR